MKCLYRILRVIVVGAAAALVIAIPVALAAITYLTCHSFDFTVCR